MEFTAEEGKQPHNNCSTLILPALSIGNVGQLAVDLLVSSLGADKVGYLDDPYVLPCVGNDAYGPEAQGDLAVALEASACLSRVGLAFVDRGVLESKKNNLDQSTEGHCSEWILLSHR
eukprot:Gb_26126 [translate_table: standard]